MAKSIKVTVTPQQKVAALHRALSDDTHVKLELTEGQKRALRATNGASPSAPDRG